MKEIISKLGRLHWPLFFLILALCSASIAFIYSATYFSEGTEFRNAWLNQIYWLCIGLGVFFSCQIKPQVTPTKATKSRI